MTILARTRNVASKAHRVAPILAVPFGFGIEVESAKERHQREQFEVGDAVFMGRAVRIPLDSPNYRSFIEAMNAPAMPRGFTTHSGSYVPSDAECVWAAKDAERQEHERQEARWEALASEAHEVEVLEDEMLLIGACG
jgi:hypothetical protein